MDMEAIWQIVASLPVGHIHWVFIFSHTRDDADTIADPSLPEHYNAVADKLAADNLSTSPSPGVGQWLVDLFRPHIQHLQYEADNSSTVQATLQYRVTASGSPLDPLHLRCTRHEQRLLLQLRAGACRQLPGWRHEVPERCLWCQNLLGRRSTTHQHAVEEAVPHIFLCPSFQPVTKEWCVATLFGDSFPASFFSDQRRFLQGPVIALPPSARTTGQAASMVPYHVGHDRAYPASA